METLDLRSLLKPYYAATAKKVDIVDVPNFLFLMIDGAIEPGMAPGTSPDFKENVSALYGAAYTLKFAFKKRLEAPVDFPVMPLEGLWWVEDNDFEITRKDNWVYRLMILQPEIVTAEHFQEALIQLRKKKGDQPIFSKLRLESFREGLSVQTLHIGPYATEPATVEKMDQFAHEHNYQKRGDHHEIYLGDPMRADPEKLKTILRHPVSA